MLLVIIVTIRCSAANKCNLMLTVVPILQNYHTTYLNNKMLSLVHHPSMKAASIAEKTLFNFILSCLSKYIAFLFEWLRGFILSWSQKLLNWSIRPINYTTNKKNTPNQIEFSNIPTTYLRVNIVACILEQESISCI